MTIQELYNWAKVRGAEHMPDEEEYQLYLKLKEKYG